MSDAKSRIGRAVGKDYGWKQVTQDLLDKKYIGTYGNCNTPWHALAAIRAGVDLTKFHGKRTPDEFFLPDLDAHIRNPETQKHWGGIVAFDPMGLYGSPPTMAATNACMDIPELVDELMADGTVVNEDKSVNIRKCAIDYAWNMKGVSEIVGFDEALIRQKLAEYTRNMDVLDTTKNTYLPPMGGMTVYFFGDLTKLSDKDTEVAVRVHDSCCGSDVFGTDICTCRPYLVYAIKGCVEVAQRGGVGIIVYFQKEGRGLGEVTKYRVYNARRNQDGGDRSEKYFHQTESIAGIQDARFQELMPDVLLWLGIRRIDWLLSMSSEKYDAIINAGIQVMQRVSIPDSYIPRNAHVEINAKIAAGYHAGDREEKEDEFTVLRSLEMVRERCGLVFKLAEADKTKHFKLNLDKLPSVVDYVVNVTKEAYPSLDVPYHSRWRQLDQASVDAMSAKWKCNETEKIRRLIDLATVSVLLDGGAGAAWRYHDTRGEVHSRSEGLALATLDMFNDGAFSSDVAVPCRVNAHGLKQLTFHNFCKGFQVERDSNFLVGAKERYELMQRLADALLVHSEFFGEEVARPGNMVDYLLPKAIDGKLSLRELWKVLTEGLENIWPSSSSGIACMNHNHVAYSKKRGDVYVYSAVKSIGKSGSELVPFHKLSQWLAYSLLEPLEKLGVVVNDLNLLTGLAEYRNGGLFVDLGVLQLREPSMQEYVDAGREFDTGSELVVEWRALTVVLLDYVWEGVLEKLNKTKEEFPMTRLLQGGTWAAGRKLAQDKRGETRSSPIPLRSFGTVF